MMEATVTVPGWMVGVGVLAVIALVWGVAAQVLAVAQRDEARRELARLMVERRRLAGGVAPVPPGPWVEPMVRRHVRTS
jgi:hypothetical protein